MDKFMSAALKEASKAYKINEVPVGAIIVKNGIIVSRAYNKRESQNNALSHAELNCIHKACKKLDTWRLDGCEMYVTLEPCAMCAGALTQSRIKKVYFGALDKKNGCVGSITNLLNINTTHKVDFQFTNDIECSLILTNFFKELRTNKCKKNVEI